MDVRKMSGEDDDLQPPPLTNSESEPNESYDPVLEEMIEDDDDYEIDVASGLGVPFENFTEFPVDGEIKQPIEASPELGEVIYTTIESEENGDELSLIMDSDRKNNLFMEPEQPADMLISEEAQIDDKIADPSAMGTDDLIVDVNPKFQENDVFTNQICDTDAGAVGSQCQTATPDPNERSSLKENMSIVKSNCQVQKITLGEFEKEQLTTAGQHILQIGEQLLAEMNIVETLLGKFGYFRKSESDEQQIMETSQLSPKSEKLTNSQIMRAITAQAKLCLLGAEQSPEEMKIAAKAAQFGSQFESHTNFLPTLTENYQFTSSSCDPNIPKNISNGTDVEFADLRRRLATLEIQMEGMNTKLESCEKQVKEVYYALCGAVNRLSEQTTSLRVQIGSESEQGALLRTTIEQKLSNFEQQILNLAKVVWQLQCETKVQMHFGHVIP